jgi:ATPase subunit of ABC transporter with duplicated ATPase domains
VEDKRKELQDFVARFSANASKSRQATSRKKLLEKLVVDDIKASTRKYPGIIFTPNRDAGDQVLRVEGLSKKTDDGTVLFKDITFTLDKGDKVAILSKEHLAITSFFQLLALEEAITTGEMEWGQTITRSYLPNENHHFFTADYNLVDWLRQFSAEKDETYIRGFLGKMLFSGEEVFKKSNVLSGGEKVRCMVSRMMLTNANCLLLNEPTNHLDLETIEAFNNALKEWKHIAIFSSHDHTFTQSIANRIIELTPNGVIDKRMTYDEYLEDERVQEQRTIMYGSVRA